MMLVDIEITKDFIKEYIESKENLYVEPCMNSYRCRIGDRSYLPSLYTTKQRAEYALIQHVGAVLKAEQKRTAKRKENAKKSKS